MEFKYAIPMLVLFLGMGFVNAATTYSSNVTFSVSVAEFIDVTISPGSITFSDAINPTANATATTPVTVTTTSNSNVPIKISIWGSNFVNGTNTIPITNLRMRANDVQPAYSDFVDPHYVDTTMRTCNATLYSGNQNCYNIAPNNTVKLWFNLFVPGGTAAGSYNAILTIQADKQ
ncbi:MAG: hypothetical protein QXW80_03890 [Candidatus Micrarchaeia archaeon]